MSTKVKKSRNILYRKKRHGKNRRSGRIGRLTTSLKVKDEEILEMGTRQEGLRAMVRKAKLESKSLKK